MINLICNQEDITFSAAGQKFFLLFSRHDPAGGITRRINENTSGGRRDAVDNFLRGQLPSIFCFPLTNRVDPGASHSVGGFNVRPVRADDERLISLVQRHLCGNGNTHHGSTGNRYPPWVNIETI